MIVMMGKLYMKVETTIQKSTKSNEPESGFLCENTIDFLSGIMSDLFLPVEFIDKNDLK